MAKLFFDQVMEFLGVDTTQDNQPVQADDPLGTSDPQFGYRDYTPAERAQEVLYGSLDTAGSMLRGVAKAGIEAPRDIYALGSAIGKIQDRTQQRLAGEPVKTIGELFTEAYNEAPSFLPDEATAERKLYDFTPMSRTYSQDASVYNLPEEFGRIAAPLPLLDYARPAQIAKLGKTAEVTPRILSAANPETGRTGFTSGGGTQIPALEPLREPTRMGGMNTLGNEDELRQARFNMQKLDRTPQQILDEVLNDPNAVNVVGEAERDAREMLGYGQFERLDDKEMQGVINMRNNLLVDRTRQFDRETLITPMSERQSVIATDRPQSATPRILEDTPKVEKEPPMLREPREFAGMFPETYTYSRLEQALLDIKSDPKLPASMTPRALKKRLEAQGITDADMEEHGLNLADYTRMNANGNQVVDIQTILDKADYPQRRMNRVILSGEGKDADEMNLQDRFDNDDMEQMSYLDYTGGDNRTAIEDYREAVFQDIGEAVSRDVNTPYSISIANFTDSPVLTDTIYEISKVYEKRGLDAPSARMEAIDALAQAYNNGGSQNWVDELGKILGDNEHWRLDDLAEQWDEARYNENPLIQQDVEFGGETYRVEGNDDFGYRVVDEQGSTIISNVYDLNEVEVQIQNEAINRGTFGYGTGGQMKWSQFLQGDSDYYEPIEEVILTYDPKSGNTFESSHYGSDVAEGYVTHLRSTARETADGKSVYHVDEIQSDLHQTGRQSGYRSEQTQRDLENAREEMDRLEVEDREAVEAWSEFDFDERKEMLDKFIMDYKDKIDRDEFLRFFYQASRDSDDIAIALQGSRLSEENKKIIKESLSKAPQVLQDVINRRVASLDGEKKVNMLERQMANPSGEYPLKDERWIKAMVRQAMERAVDKGNFDGITFSNPQNQINQWSKRHEKLYNEVYENKLKSILDTIGKEYGVKPRKVKLNDPEMQEAGENWYLPLTPEMKEIIEARGVPLASAVGATPAILDRINKEREDKTPRILRTA